MNSKIKRYYDIARAVSYSSEFSRIKIGSIIVYQKDILAVSANLKKSHPLQKRLNLLRFNDRYIDNCNNYLHAEMATILKTNKPDLKGSILVIYRENKHGNLANCRPCNACMAMIRQVKINKIYYTTEQGYCCEEIIY